MQPSVSRVRSIYDRIYARKGLMGTHLDLEYSRATKQALLAMCANVPNPRILDLGTGDGDLGEFIPAGREWHGLDISCVGVRRARTRFPNLQATVATAEKLPYADHCFGAVIAADTIEHVFDLDEALQEIRRVLVVGGKFALSVPTPNSLRRWARNRLLRQIPSPLLLFRLFRVVFWRILLFGRATFQPIDRDLSLSEWLSLLSAHRFQLLQVVEWPTSPLEPIVYLLSSLSEER